MHSSREIGLLVGLSLAVLSSMSFAESPKNRKLAQPIYDADPQHLWNRLHAALFLRVGPDGHVYGQDRLEPLLWPQSMHLLEEQSHDRVVAVLKEFLDKSGERLVEDATKKAVLQRDLWLVFNWLEGPHLGFAKNSFTAKETQAAQQRIRPLLARAINRLALTAKEIQNLPENYRAAVASQDFAHEFDPKFPKKPYLPSSLFSADGPWVCVGRTNGPTAPQHLREDQVNQYTNSVFFVFLRLPEGRAATSNYLKRLALFDQPLVVQNPKKSKRRLYPFVPNPSLPQFPTGTEIALVRKAMLIDTSHNIVLSPLTESVQLRVVYGDVSALSKQVRENPSRFFGDNKEWIESWQSFQEFRLSRTQLFTHKSGGLSSVGFEEHDFKTGFRAHPWDEFERPLPTDQPFLKRAQPQTITGLCFACHRLPGVYSFNSYKTDLEYVMRRKDGDKERPLALSEMAISNVSEAAIGWKKSRPNWKSLLTLLPKRTNHHKMRAQ